MSKKQYVFPELKTEYDYFVLRFDDREIKLLYRIRQYSLVSEDKVKNYRRNGIQLRRFGNPLECGKVEVRYYQPYAIKQVSLRTKKRVIDKVLDLVLEGTNVTLRDKIESQWYDRNAHKTSKEPLMDREARVLDTLATYFLGGVEGEGILTRDMSRTIRSREIVTIAGMLNSDNESNITEFSSNAKNQWEYRKMDSSKRKRVVRSLPKRWTNTVTYKLDNLYSLVPNRREMTTEWTKGKKIIQNPDYHYGIERLIDPTREYTSDWCLVDTNNMFELRGTDYLIDDSVKAYRIDSVTKRYPMDKILVMQQDGIMHFFDQNIDRVDSGLVVQV